MMEDWYFEFIKFVKNLYKKDSVALHEPLFIGNEKKYVLDCIDSTFVSSVGQYVNLIEKKLSEYTNSEYCIMTVNGTSALHVALSLAGVMPDTEVITQPLTFVATCNAISYCGAKPVFVDVDEDTLGMSPKSLKKFLKENCKIYDKKVVNKITGKEISAIVPMHTFGHTCRIDEIVQIAMEFNIPVVEDAAEAMGSFYKNKHAGIFGLMGVLSFNGNKIITSGGGGAIITDNQELAQKAKHISTTAKLPHKWEYYHDEIGYNYRMPNINAALLLGQLENLEKFVKIKRELAKTYKNFFDAIGINFITEPINAKSNYWLNAIMLDSRKERDEFLEFTNSNGVNTRPVWVLMNKLPMYKGCYTFESKTAEYLEDRVVNIPSGVML
ncbi:MAG: aminotransferase DegT [Candidatus Woesearchaeota archaeon]|nr:MAG: aminotransferase DegT [Candidatus Woesearchaeota archaeon]